MQSEEEQIWDPEHDWILQFERILKPGAGLASKHTFVNLIFYIPLGLKPILEIEITYLILVSSSNKISISIGFLFFLLKISLIIPSSTSLESNCKFNWILN